MRLKRIITVLAVALVMAAMMVATAAPAFADKGGGGHCTRERQGDFEQVGVEECAGGSGGPGGGGGGKTTNVFIEQISETGPVFTETTGGGSNFRGTGEGGGGKCTEFLGEDLGCQTGKLAER